MFDANYTDFCKKLCFSYQACHMHDVMEEYSQEYIFVSFQLAEK